MSRCTQLLVALLLSSASTTALRAEEWVDVTAISRSLCRNLDAPTTRRLPPAPGQHDVSARQPSGGEAETDPSAEPQTAALPVAPAAFLEELPPSQQLDINQDPATGIETQKGRAWSDTIRYDISAYARGYYRSDRRLWFTGLESTFGAEGGLYGFVETDETGWTTRLDAELYLNQPFDRNILVDTPTRASFSHNFDIDVVEISQLAISAREGDFMIAVGKMVTPFGRFYFPLFSNEMDDAPFIRSEAIRWRETGILLQYDPSIFVGTFALTNGGFDRDANSSKAIVARLGLEDETWAVGGSVKWQDGIGSEGQKERNNHVGLDAMLRWGRWMLSGEVIYDQYGRRKGDLMLDDITWGRSLYNRQLRRADGEPLEGVGYYVDLGYIADSWQLHFNYGEYFPDAIGDRIHDEISRRGLVKFAYDFTDSFSWYTAVMLENSVPRAFDGEHPREGLYVLVGFQLTL